MQKIILADNQAVFRTGAARLLLQQDGFRIVGQCDDAARLFKAVESFPAAVAVFASSVGADLEALTARATETKCRLVAVLENAESAHPFLKANLPGIVYRDVGSTELVGCVRAVARGGGYVQQREAALRGALESDLVSERVRSKLTPKELKILSLILQGYKNKDIAQELNNSEQVIKNGLRSIFDKTGVSDRLELALFTISHRLLEEPNPRPSEP